MKLFYFIYLSVSSFLIKFFSLKKYVIINSSYNSNYTFNGRYLFEYLFDQDYDVYFVLDSDITDVPERFRSNIISSKGFKNILFILKAKVWITSSFEKPLRYCLFKHKSRMIYHLGHGVPLKNIGLQERRISFLKFINRYVITRSFTHVLAYSDAMIPVMKGIFKNERIKYVTLGQPRNDAVNVEGIHKFLKKIPYIIDSSRCSKLCLYSPTWRPGFDTEFFPFISSEEDIKLLNVFLKENNIYIFVRPHPLFPFSIPDLLLSSDNVLLLDGRVLSDISPFLSVFDFIITDYSSIYIDALEYECEYIFIPYDYDYYKENVGFSFDYFESTPGRKVNSLSEFIDCFSCSLEYDDKVKDLRLKFNTKTVDNCNESMSLVSNHLNL